MKTKFEEVKDFFDEKLNLGMVLVRHSYEKDGVSIGGCRYKPYSNKNEAIEDAKRLAFKMTLKYQVVGLPFGGLKAVIYSMDESLRDQSFMRIGDWIDSYSGSCVIATDLGTTLYDMINVLKRTKHVIDIPKELGGFGSFAPIITQGVINSLEAALQSEDYHDGFENLRPFVLGLGNSGLPVAKKLVDLGSDVSGYDLDKNKNSEAENCGVIINQNYDSYASDMFIPCSAGNTVNEKYASTINTKIVGGTENNPLASEKVEEILHKRGIVYIPDFIISSGTIVVDDLLIEGKIPSLEEALERTRILYDFTMEVIHSNRGKNEIMSHTALRKLGY